MRVAPVILLRRTCVVSLIVGFAAGFATMTVFNAAYEECQNDLEMEQRYVDADVLPVIDNNGGQAHLRRHRDNVAGEKGAEADSSSWVVNLTASDYRQLQGYFTLVPL